MKFKITILFILLFTSVSFSANFTKNSIKESEKTKVIFAFDNDSKKLVGIINFEAMNGKYGESLIKNYKNTTFFLGYIEGGFEQKNGEINPLRGSILTIIKDRDSTPYKNPNLGLWDSKNKNPNLGLWDSTKTLNSFINEQNFPDKEFTTSFNYEWPAKWKGYLIKNDKNYLIINIL